MTDTQVDQKMPRYVCHKEVHALEIAKITTFEDKATLITPADEGFAPFTVEDEFINKHCPQVGGYYVVYEDGYVSFSPRSAFKRGYKLID